jgi:hypothetical protein
MSYTDVFGGANIYPSEISYSALTLATDVTLSWPEETSASSDLATRIIDVTASAAALNITLPDALRTGVGQTLLVNNRGTNTFTIKDNAGGTVVSITSGTIWQVYLSDNSTAAGVWQSLQFGASVSQANAASLAGTGLVAISTTLSPAVPITTFNSDYTLGVTDRAKMFVWQGTGGILTLPLSSTVANNWFFYARNAGSGAIALTPAGGNLIDSGSVLSLQPGESVLIATDGSEFYSIGFGQSAIFAFDYTSIDVSGGGSYTLAGAELNRIAYSFTGVLTADRTIIVPATVQQYWISNATTGSFLFTVKTLAGTGLSIDSGARAIYYCDGTNVVDADSATASYPILVSQGGTGATTASAARINLGATSVGDALFTAATQAAAWAALGDILYLSGGTF